MSVADFDNGYWYATEIKAVAQQIGVVGSSKLRKDELEAIIRRFLKTFALGRAPRQLRRVSGPKDSDIGLKLSLPVVVYTSNSITKNVIVEQAKRMSPGFREKPGSRHRLNRWREEKQGKAPRLLTAISCASLSN